MPDPADIPRPGTRRRARVSTGVYLAGLLAYAAAMAASFVQPEHEYGESLWNLLSYAATLLLLGGSVAWAAFFAPLPAAGRAAFVASFLLPAVAYVALVRRVDPDGHMNFTARFRWEDTAAEARAAAPAPAVAVAVELLPPAATDYVSYRGAGRDGVVPAASADFTRPPKEVWRVGVGDGFAGMAVAGDRLVTLEQIGTREAVVGYDAADGRELWRQETDARFTESTGNGPRSTPAVDGREVYALGAVGHLSRVDLATGELAWQVDAFDRFGLDNATWGTAGSPLLAGDLVIANVGSPGSGGLTAFDRETGETVWRHDEPAPAGSDGPRNAAGYSSPMLATFGNEEVVLLFDGEGLRAHDPADGTELWFAPFGNEFLVNVAQPLVYPDGRVFVCGSYGMGGQMLRVDGREVETLWKDRRLMKCKFSSPVAYEGHIYGLSEGILECLSEDGERAWKRGRYGHGQLLLAGNTLVILSEDGRVVFVEATPEEHRELVNEPVIDDPKVWNPPTLSAGRLFVRGAGAMVRLRL